MGIAEDLKKHAHSRKPHKCCYYARVDSKGCAGPIINAHTVQKSGSLQKIALNGHVRHFLPNGQNVFENNGKLTAKLVGINRASTFYGFCRHHDNFVFSPIENHTFEDCPEHATLLGYRAVCKEIHAKEDQRVSHLEIDNIIDDKWLNEKLKDQRQVQLRWMIQALAELNELRGMLEDSISKSVFERTNYVSIRFSILPEILCAAAFIPEFSFDGNVIQFLGASKKPKDYLTFNLVNADGQCVVLFQWVGDSAKNEQFLVSLLSRETDHISEYISRLVFEFFENSYISPYLWNKLSFGKKKRIGKRVNNIFGHSKDCLATGSLAVVNWPLASIRTNVAELRSYER